MPEAYTLRVANRLGAVALTLSDGIREATEAATGMAGGVPAALVSLAEWADGRRALVWLEPGGRELAERALEARARVVLAAVAELDAAGVQDLERLLGALLDSTTIDVRAAMETCRLCDAHACGHYGGDCPVTRAADRHRAAA